MKTQRLEDQYNNDEDNIMIGKGCWLLTYFPIKAVYKYLISIILFSQLYFMVCSCLSVQKSTDLTPENADTYLHRLNTVYWCVYVFKYFID